MSKMSPSDRSRAKPSFMVEGRDGDDRFRMVEDELAYIAGKFTAHLHAAEYHRQKQQAKARNAETIDSISRPIVGRMTPAVSTKHSRLEKTRKRRDGLRRALANGKGGGLDVESDEEEAPWVGTSLQGLMEAPQGSGSGVRLSRLASVGLGTKAASGIRPAPGGERAQAGTPAVRAPRPGYARPRAAGDRPPRASAPPTRQATWPQQLGVSREETLVLAPRVQDEMAVVPIISDSDDDLIASLRRKRREGRAPREARRSRVPPSSSATAQVHDRKPEADSDIIPSFL